MKVISVRCLEGETSVGGRMRMSVSRLDPKQPEAKPRDLSGEPVTSSRVYLNTPSQLGIRVVG